MPENPQIIGSAIEELARQVTRLPAGVLANMLSIYRLQGHDHGYHAALSAVLMSLVEVTEEFIGLQQNPPDNLRGVLYGFVEHLDHRIRRLSIERGECEDGLGI